MNTDPDGQDFGECGSFAYVSTHNVSGLVWKHAVAIDDESDGFELTDPDFVDGITVSLSPVDGKNLAGEEESYTSAEEDDDDTEDIDETHQFDFGQIAAGVYEVGVPSGWRARLGDKGTDEMVGNALNPLDGDEALDVTPATGTVYGVVSDSEGFPAAEVTVNVNGKSAETDEVGRYIVEGISAQTRTIKKVKHSNSFFVETDHDGNSATLDIIAFAANSPTKHDIDISGVGRTASISGTVTASGTNAPVAGVEIKVDGEAPENAATSGANKGKLVTGADGTYTATIAAKEVGQSAKVTASKAGMTFVPAELSAPAHAGAEISGIDFTGFVNATISGRVKGPDGRAMAGVEVTATKVGAAEDAAATDSHTTTSRGVFSLNVPFGNYTIAASKDDYTFAYPNDNQLVNVAPGQSVNFGDIQAMSPKARGVTATRLTQTTGADSVTSYTGQVRVTWTAKADDVPEGYDDATYDVETSDDGGETWDDASATLVADSSVATFTTQVDTAFMVRVVATADNTEGGEDLVLNSDPATVAAIAPTASSVAARRSVADATADSLVVSWDNTTNSNTAQRVAIRVDLGSLGQQWLVGANGDPGTVDSNTRSWTLTIGETFSQDWSTLDGAQTLTVTAADLLKAVMVRVEARQGDEVDDDDEPVWRGSSAVSVDAKPDNGG
jgi:hypothetical protein